MWEDPIVEEVRKIRREIEEEQEEDFDRIYALAVRIQNESKYRTVSKPLRSIEETQPATVERL